MRRLKRRNAISGQFAARLIEMIESPAFRVLSLSARRVLDRIEIEMAHHGGYENGRLPVTFENFQSYGIDRHAIAPAIRECVALGFIIITERGRAGNAEFRSPNLFRLTYRHGDGVPGDGTHEWRRIETIEDAERIARAARATSAQKQNSSGGKRRRPVGKTHTENGGAPMGNTPTTAIPEKSPLLSISRVGVEESDQGGSRSAPPRSAVASEPPPVSPELILLAKASGRSAAETIELLRSVPEACSVSSKANH